MKILSIETSCDETGVAILDITGDPLQPKIKIVANALLSQIAIHEQYGGVYPMLAKREHQKNLPILLEKVLDDARENPDAPQLDFIAVTAGPGLEPALWTGIAFAQELGKKWGKPVVPVNHMKGHIWSVLTESLRLELPALALLVSGGHTEIVLLKSLGEYQILGRTVDDAVGEAFDKVARMLGLAYPGGPKISALANKSRERDKTDTNLHQKFVFPRPMIHSGDLNFSFSGLKTAVLYKVRAEARDDDEFKEDIARAFEDAAFDTLISKTRTALEIHTGEIKSLIVAGGVASSPRLISELKDMVKDFEDVTLLAPDKSLATDNAIMIGLAAYVEVNTNPSILSEASTIKAQGNLSITSSQ